MQLSDPSIYKREPNIPTKLHKSVANWNRFTIYNAIAHYYKYVSLWHEYSLPFFKTKTHIFKIFIRSRFRSGESIMLSYFGISCKTYITINPMNSVTVIFVIVISIYIRSEERRVGKECRS